jgi:hypothetical protein
MAIDLAHASSSTAVFHQQTKEKIVQAYLEFVKTVPGIFQVCFLDRLAPGHPALEYLDGCFLGLSDEEMADAEDQFREGFRRLSLFLTELSVASAAAYEQLLSWKSAPPDSPRGLALFRKIDGIYITGMKSHLLSEGVNGFLHVWTPSHDHYQKTSIEAAKNLIRSLLTYTDLKDNPLNPFDLALSFLGEFKKAKVHSL